MAEDDGCRILARLRCDGWQVLGGPLAGMEQSRLAASQGTPFFLYLLWRPKPDVVIAMEGPA